MQKKVYENFAPDQVLDIHFKKPMRFSCIAGRQTIKGKVLAFVHFVFRSYALDNSALCKEIEKCMKFLKSTSKTSTGAKHSSITVCRIIFYGSLKIVIPKICRFPNCHFQLRWKVFTSLKEISEPIWWMYFRASHMNQHTSTSKPSKYNSFSRMWIKEKIYRWCRQNGSIYIFK